MSCNNIGRDAVEPNILKLIERTVNTGGKSSNFIIIMSRIRYYQISDTSKHDNGQNGLRLGTRPGNSSLARKIRVSGTKMAYSILENSIQVITCFRVDISEVNYATCRYIIDNIQTHFPF